MLEADVPSRFTVAFGTDAPGGNIRAIPETTTDPTAASLDLGFPTATLTPISAGGAPPDGRDFNGLFLQITQWSQWQAAGAPVGYDATFATAIGGYPKGAILSAAGILGGRWISVVDNNASNPDAAGANWYFFSVLGGATTGDGKITLKTVADPGWVFANDGSLSNVGNGGTTLASASAFNLFAALWNGVSNTYAPTQDNTGTPVARGATALADFTTNNRRIALTKVLGRAIIAAGTGAGLTSRALGQTLGEETHLQTLAELAAHAHTGVWATGSGGGNIGAGAVAAYAPSAQSTSTVGSSTPFNVMQPSSAWNIMVCL